MAASRGSAHWRRLYDMTAGTAGAATAASSEAATAAAEAEAEVVASTTEAAAAASERAVAAVEEAAVRVGTTATYQGFPGCVVVQVLGAGRVSIYIPGQGRQEECEVRISDLSFESPTHAGNPSPRPMEEVQSSASTSSRASLAVPYNSFYMVSEVSTAPSLGASSSSGQVASQTSQVPTSASSALGSARPSPPPRPPPPPPLPPSMRDRPPTGYCVRIRPTLATPPRLGWSYSTPWRGLLGTLRETRDTSDGWEAKVRFRCGSAWVDYRDLDFRSPGRISSAGLPEPPEAGLLVTFRQDVYEPRYGWGKVCHGMVGTVIFVAAREVGWDLTVAFPKKKLFAHSSDLETVRSGDIDIATMSEIDAAAIEAMRERDAEAGGLDEEQADMSESSTMRPSDSSLLDPPPPSSRGDPDSDPSSLPTPAAVASAAASAAAAAAAQATAAASAASAAAADAAAVVGPAAAAASAAAAVAAVVAVSSAASWLLDDAPPARPAPPTPVAIEFPVGSFVQVRPTVYEPTLGWGNIRLGDVGVVTAVEGDVVEANFRRHRFWRGMAHELLSVGPGDVDVDTMRRQDRAERVQQFDMSTLSDAEDDEDEIAHLPRCKLCYEKKVNMAMVPCGHLVCEVCARKVGEGEAAQRRCPFCRKPLKSLLKVFVP